MEAKYPKEIGANENNDLLFRTSIKHGATSDKEKKKKEEQVHMEESGPSTGPLEYFTE